MDKEKQRFVVKLFMLKAWESKNIHQKLMNILSDDASWLSQIKILLQRLRTGDLSYSDLPLAR
jgi:hypothetical protein